MRILVLGYFGYETNQLDGQTIKTRDVYTLLRENAHEDVEYFDTQSFKVSKFNFFKMLWMIVRADHIFYLPAHSNLTYIFPIIFIFIKILNIKLNYLVVGGWLYSFLDDKKIYQYMLRNINGIYVETDHLLNSLSKYKFKNLHKLYNFRVVDIEKITLSENINQGIRLVFMARVHPMKGVDVIFDIDKSINKIGLKNVSIDIYGQILPSYEVEFFDKIKKSNVNYMGVLEPSEIYKVLQAYDLMLFPTKYYTEGFPGTILDSYIAGLPVVVSNWLNAEEFVTNGETGCIVEFNNDELFVKKVVSLVNNSNYIYALKNNVKDRRLDYSSTNAWAILSKAIYSCYLD